jgi:hypothetical protein
MTNALAFLVLTGAVFTPIPPDYQYAPEELPSEQAQMATELIRAAHSRHDPKGVLAESYQFVSYYRTSLRTLQRRLKENELSDSIAMYVHGDVRSTPYSFMYGNDGQLEALNGSGSIGITGLEGETPEERSANLEQLKQTWMSQEEAFLLAEEFESILRNYGYPLEFIWRPERSDLVNVEFRARPYAHGYPVIDQGGRLLIDVQDGTFHLMLDEHDFDYEFVVGETAPQIDQSQAFRSAITVIEASGRVQRGEVVRGEFAFKRGYFRPGDPFTVTEVPARWRNFSQRPHRYFLRYELSVKAEDSSLHTVVVDPQTGAPVQLRYHESEDRYLIGAEERQAALVSGLWSLPGEDLEATIEAVDVPLPGSESASVSLAASDGQVAIFDWHESEGILMFDGKAYRPDDALAEAIRNRPQIEPPAWLVEALKDKE